MTDRQKERSAMALLAVGNVKKNSDWKKIKSTKDDYAPTTREIISFYNDYLEDDLSSGSYDDIRRKDLKPLMIMGMVKPSSIESNISDPTRGYQISLEYARIIKNFGQSDWQAQFDAFKEAHPKYEERIGEVRHIEMIPVTLPDGSSIQLKDGEHNSIQKAVIENFLPRYGYGAEILYCGDSNNKYSVIYEEKRLNELGFSDIRQSKLPDIIAYSRAKDWVYLIEAYNTSNPITKERKVELINEVLGKCADKAIFVTAFENMDSFRKCTESLAWESEVWIATDPDHMIHCDGGRFLGPYKKAEK